MLVPTAAAETATLHYFYGQECPHCAMAKPFVDALEARGLSVKRYEVWHDPENAALLRRMVEARGTTVQAVPVFIIGDKVLVGWDSAKGRGREIEAALAGAQRTPIVSLPLLGEVDPRSMSLFAFTTVLGLLDGFNPCSMWVLLLLLTLLINAGSRRHMVIVGGLFIVVSGVGYLLFITTWLNLFMITGMLGWLRVVVGAGAVFMGLVNMKELFFFKRWVSFTIAQRHKPLVYRKMRALMQEMSLPAILVGVASLAMTVNLVEFLCTAGFPAIFAQVIAMNQLAPLQSYFYIFWYILMYEVDDLVVLGIALWAFREERLSEMQGRWLKFAAGLAMVALGALLMFRPQLLMFG